VGVADGVATVPMTGEGVAVGTNVTAAVGVGVGKTGWDVGVGINGTGVGVGGMDLGGMGVGVGVDGTGVGVGVAGEVGSTIMRVLVVVPGVTRAEAG